MTADLISSSASITTRPLWLLTEGALTDWLASQPPPIASWIRAQGFQAERHRLVLLPGAQGMVEGAVLGLGALPDANALTLWHAAACVDRLGEGAWRIVTPLSASAAGQFALGWLVGAYRYTRYRSAPPAGHSLLQIDGIDADAVRATAEALALARDLINTPANDLGPLELEEAVGEMALRHGATFRSVVGEQLREQGFPLIHAVGRASARAPRLLELCWGEPGAYAVTLVGKGVCFDSGGLDLKPSAGMLLMKKDMGGAACALALAGLLMRLRAPIRLRLLIAAVENSVSGDAYRPGDVLSSRKGLTVEIGNTDAEGRLVLADALALADSEPPDLLVDLATLTGAARTALGPELPAAYSNDAALLRALHEEGDLENDPVWPMPLWGGYEEDLGSKVADLSNVAPHGFAGSVLGALFLRRFVTASPSWLHIDLYAWNPKERPGRPVGAEAQCVRALYRLIRSRSG